MLDPRRRHRLATRGAAAYQKSECVVLHDAPDHECGEEFRLLSEAAYVITILAGAAPEAVDVLNRNMYGTLDQLDLRDAFKVRVHVVAPLAMHCMFIKPPRLDSLGGREPTLLHCKVWQTSPPRFIPEQSV